MGRARRLSGRWSGPGPWWVAAVVLLIAGTALLQAGFSRTTNADAVNSVTLPRTSVSPPPPQISTTSPPRVPRRIPLALRIPAIGLAVPLSQLGLNPDGTVQVPTNPAMPGWFHLGPSPGQVGSAVILGHVDSTQGPAVFYLLSSLHPGDGVSVRMSDGVMAQFVVIRLVTYANAEFPARQVYGPHGDRALQLVTCGGGFSYTTRHYLGNLVVYTRLVSMTYPTPITHIARSDVASAS